ncbi:hypothetical protein Pint_29819 [Pistacia integerrima]|uniref:Uncharacterized protein n=1 Tax=Pistacia integerrima TaxID=434235 RepID=A0ACC0X069_9ROSI|nr:hypothetical protein Pint_29819 [Pistacia integerrima]
MVDYCSNRSSTGDHHLQFVFLHPKIKKQHILNPSSDLITTFLHQFVTQPQSRWLLRS